MTPAGVWQRVSSGAQDEANQLPDLLAWCESHGYDVAARYVLNGKSASKGQQDKDLDQAFTDMAAGKIRVLVVWAADRLERRGALAALTLAQRARDAGGRIEYVKDAHLNATNDMSDVMLALAGTVAQQESKRKSERIQAKHAALREAGALVGRPPWGFTTGAARNGRALVPTAEGRTYVPAIFAKVISGDSLATVAEWLTAERVTPFHGADTWSPKSVGQLVRNPTYAGRRVNGDGVTIHRCEALVSASVFDAAGAALDSRRQKGQRGERMKRETAMLTGVIHCAKCTGPMYRVYVGAPGRRMAYYRCAADPAFGAARRSECRNLVPVAAADAKARELLARVTDPVLVPEWQDGDTTATELAEVDAEIADAMARYKAGALPLYEFTATITGLDARRKELTAAEPRPGRYVLVPTGQTYGELAAGLDDAGFRRLLSGNAWIYMDSARPGYAAFSAMVPGVDGERVAHQEPRAA